MMRDASWEQSKLADLAAHEGYPILIRNMVQMCERLAQKALDDGRKEPSDPYAMMRSNGEYWGAKAALDEAMRPEKNLKARRNADRKAT